MSHKNKRKFQRLVIAPTGTPPIEEAFAIIELSETQLRRPIHNISYRGVGIRLQPGDESQLRDKSDLKITLEIENTLAKVEGQITHVTSEFAGISFISLSDVSRRVISAYLDPRYLGSNMRQVPAEQLNVPNLQLFIGLNQTRLSLTLAAGKIEKFELVYASNYLSMDEAGKMVTGKSGYVFLERDLTVDVMIDRQILEGALRLLRYTPLELTLRMQMEALVQGALTEKAGAK